MTKTQNNRNAWLDIIKFFASLMVVFIHISFPGQLGKTVDALARFAVPLFFMVSGFFSFGLTPKNIIRRLIKIIYLYFIASLIYYLVDVTYYSLISIKHKDFSLLFNYFNNKFTLNNLILFLFFNFPFSSIHLWFLLALIYVYCIWLIVLKLHISDKVIFITGIILLLTHLFLGEFLSIFHIAIKTKYIRNFALMGLPFFCFGYLFNKCKIWLKSIKNGFLVVILLLSFLEIVLSNLLVGRNELYLGSVFCCFSFLIIAIKLEDKPTNRLLCVISSTNTDIYIYHLVIANVISTFLSALHCFDSSQLFAYLWPLIICLASISFSLVKNLFLAKLKSFKRTKKQ